VCYQVCPCRLFIAGRSLGRWQVHGTEFVIVCFCSVLTVDLHGPNSLKIKNLSIQKKTNTAPFQIKSILNIVLSRLLKFNQKYTSTYNTKLVLLDIIKYNFRK
jgi:hypothetical protein